MKTIDVLMSIFLVTAVFCFAVMAGMLSGAPAVFAVIGGACVVVAVVLPLYLSMRDLFK